MSYRFVSLCIFGFTALIAGRAWAGGYEYGTDNGAESLARAGASTAMSLPSALYTNIAGIADTRKVDIYLSNNFAMRHLWFQRAPLEGRAFDAVEDETPIFFGPSLAVHFRLNRWLAMAVGIHGPAAVGWGHFPHGTAEQDADPSQNLSGASRFDLTDMDLLLLHPTLALGLRVPGHEQLRIALSFQPSIARLSFTTYGSSGPASMLELVGDEIRSDLEVWDYFVPAGQLGLLYRLWRFEMGAQVRLSASIDGKGDAVPTLHPRDPEDAEYPPDERPVAAVRFKAPLPLAVARFGVRYGHPRLDAPADAVYAHEREVFDIELDFIYENTSTNDGFAATMEDVNVYMNVFLNEINLYQAHEWRDTYAVRLGGSYHLLNGMLSLSAGGSWESATSPNEYTRLDFACWGRFGVAAGVTLRLSVVELTLAYQHLFMLEREVTQGEARQLLGIEGGGLSDLVVNNGTYRGSYDILALAVAIRL